MSSSEGQQSRTSFSSAALVLQAGRLEQRKRVGITGIGSSRSSRLRKCHHFISCTSTTR